MGNKRSRIRSSDSKFASRRAELGIRGSEFCVNDADLGSRDAAPGFSN